MSVRRGDGLACLMLGGVVYSSKRTMPPRERDPGLRDLVEDPGTRDIRMDPGNRDLSTDGSFRDIARDRGWLELKELGAPLRSPFEIALHRSGGYQAQSMLFPEGVAAARTRK